ncbi:MAG: hypothetical protein IJ837_02400 [Clostridia bacterium]|nr:hypothetical protein [Clostridia bacterium]
MNVLLKIFLKLFVSLIILVAIVVGGIWGVGYFKYNVNVFTITSDLLKISNLPKVEEIAPNRPQQSDYESIMEKINNALTIQPLGAKVIEKDDENNYTINFDNATKYLTSDLNLTSKETCALMNIVLSSQEPVIQNGNEKINLKSLDFQLLQIYYADLENVTIDEKNYTKNSFNFVASLSLKSIKEKMNSFPLSTFKSKVPDTLYVSSTVEITMENGTITYTTKSQDILVNTLKKENLAPIFSLLNNFIKVGTVDEFNKNLCDVCVNMILGNESSQGFAYSLANQKVSGLEIDYYASEGFLFEEKTIDSENQVVLTLKKGCIK